MEGCSLFADARKSVERKEMCTWRTRHIHKYQKKKKGPVEPEKEEEEEKLERFFCHIYNFHIPVAAPVPVFVPAELPPRYTINFVPANTTDDSIYASASPVDASAVSVGSAPSTDFSIVSSANFDVNASPVVASLVNNSVTDCSVISSVNFATPPPVIASSCIEPNT